MSEDEAYLRVPDNVTLVLETPPGSNSLQWEQCRNEVNSVLDEIKVKDIKQDGRPAIIISILSDGLYRISPFDCEIDSYSIREKQFLMKTTEENHEDKSVLTTVGFALPIKITLDYKQEEGRRYHKGLQIRDGHIQYFG